MRRRYTVYRMDSVTGRKEPIGCIEERRRNGRRASRDYFALLAEARKLFGIGKEETIHIVIDVRDRVGAIRREANRKESEAQDHGCVLMRSREE